MPVTILLSPHLLCTSTLPPTTTLKIRIIPETTKYCSINLLTTYQHTPLLTIYNQKRGFNLHPVLSTICEIEATVSKTLQSHLQFETSEYSPTHYHPKDTTFC